ncbi:hypothetical protein HOU02_gp317 [Caulobacter phage CcrBL9]|uniref:Uncharacterized protein n=1 Tax=Caulobacter phage CcrBL9 TaxID=2283270 RepID=A0A385EF61_9CAUD|nr:hypothetical protein HOU02_gp317 [Caulobacter phage CcrBL9]AXQ69408.1 hypothetical protein CcrBL9_gp384 [Caulobacter phage CcrBL9]
MCGCVNVEMGSYANQEERWAPTGRLVGIDRCLLDEIEGLWRLGVVTVESCCGHNQASGYIAVASGHEPIMRAMGYQPDPRVPDRVDLFSPKSL